MACDEVDESVLEQLQAVTGCSREAGLLALKNSDGNVNEAAESILICEAAAEVDDTGQKECEERPPKLSIESIEHVSFASEGRSLEEGNETESTAVVPQLNRKQTESVASRKCNRLRKCILSEEPFTLQLAQTVMSLVVQCISLVQGDIRYTAEPIQLFVAQCALQVVEILVNEPLQMTHTYIGDLRDSYDDIVDVLSSSFTLAKMLLMDGSDPLNVELGLSILSTALDCDAELYVNNIPELFCKAEKLLIQPPKNGVDSWPKFNSISFHTLLHSLIVSDQDTISVNQKEIQQIKWLGAHPMSKVLNISTHLPEPHQELIQHTIVTALERLTSVQEPMKRDGVLNPVYIQLYRIALFCPGPKYNYSQPATTSATNNEPLRESHWKATKSATQNEKWLKFHEWWVSKVGLRLLASTNLEQRLFGISLVEQALSRSSGDDAYQVPRQRLACNLDSKFNFVSMLYDKNHLHEQVLRRGMPLMREMLTISRAWEDGEIVGKWLVQIWTSSVGRHEQEILFDHIMLITEQVSILKQKVASVQRLRGTETPSTDYSVRDRIVQWKNCANSIVDAGIGTNTADLVGESKRIDIGPLDTETQILDPQIMLHHANSGRESVESTKFFNHLLKKLKELVQSDVQAGRREVSALFTAMQRRGKSGPLFECGTIEIACQLVWMCLVGLLHDTSKEPVTQQPLKRATNLCGENHENATGSLINFFVSFLSCVTGSYLFEAYLVGMVHIVRIHDTRVLELLAKLGGTQGECDSSIPQTFDMIVSEQLRVVQIMLKLFEAREYRECESQVGGDDSSVYRRSASVVDASETANLDIPASVVSESLNSEHQMDTDLETASLVENDNTASNRTSEKFRNDRVEVVNKRDSTFSPPPNTATVTTTSEPQGHSQYTKSHFQPTTGGAQSDSASIQDNQSDTGSIRHLAVSVSGKLEVDSKSRLNEIIESMEREYKLMEVLFNHTCTCAKVMLELSASTTAYDSTAGLQLLNSLLCFVILILRGSSLTISQSSLEELLDLLADHQRQVQGFMRLSLNTILSLLFPYSTIGLLKSTTGFTSDLSAQLRPCGLDPDQAREIFESFLLPRVLRVCSGLRPKQSTLTLEGMQVDEVDTELDYAGDLLNAFFAYFCNVNSQYINVDSAGIIESVTGHTLEHRELLIAMALCPRFPPDAAMSAVHRITSILHLMKPYHAGYYLEELLKCLTGCVADCRSTIVNALAVKQSNTNEIHATSDIPEIKYVVRLLSRTLDALSILSNSSPVKVDRSLLGQLMEISPKTSTRGQKRKAVGGSGNSEQNENLEQCTNPLFRSAQWDNPCFLSDIEKDEQVYVLASHRDVVNGTAIKLECSFVPKVARTPSMMDIDEVQLQGIIILTTAHLPLCKLWDLIAEHLISKESMTQLSKLDRKDQFTLTQHDREVVVKSEEVWRSPLLNHRIEWPGKITVHFNPESTTSEDDERQSISDENDYMWMYVECILSLHIEFYSQCHHLLGVLSAPVPQFDDPELDSLLKTVRSEIWLFIAKLPPKVDHFQQVDTLIGLRKQFIQQDAHSSSHSELVYSLEALHAILIANEKLFTSANRLVKLTSRKSREKEITATAARKLKLLREACKCIVLWSGYRTGDAKSSAHQARDEAFPSQFAGLSASLAIAQTLIEEGMKTNTLSHLLGTDVASETTEEHNTDSTEQVEAEKHMLFALNAILARVRYFSSKSQQGGATAYQSQLISQEANRAEFGHSGKIYEHREYESPGESPDSFQQPYNSDVSDVAHTSSHDNLSTNHAIQTPSGTLSVIGTTALVLNRDSQHNRHKVARNACSLASLLLTNSNTLAMGTEAYELIRQMCLLLIAFESKSIRESLFKNLKSVFNSSTDTAQFSILSQMTKCLEVINIQTVTNGQFARFFKLLVWMVRSCNWPSQAEIEGAEDNTADSHDSVVTRIRCAKRLVHSLILSVDMVLSFRSRHIRSFEFEFYEDFVIECLISLKVLLRNVALGLPEANLVAKLCHKLVFIVPDPQCPKSWPLAAESNIVFEETSSLLQTLCTNRNQREVVMKKVRLSVLSQLQSYMDSTVPISHWRTQPDKIVCSNEQYVGLVNQGSTCYMNSVIQQFYMSLPLRRLVLAFASCTSSSTSNQNNEADKKDDNMSKHKELQALRDSMHRMFHFLDGCRLRAYDASDAVDASRVLELSNDVVQQNDAQEFCSKLVECLDESLKGSQNDTVQESHKEFFVQQSNEESAQETQENTIGPFERLLGGQISHVNIKKGCPHPPTKRTDSFVCLELQIKGHRKIEGSLEEMVKGELLDGENKVNCDECGTKYPAIRRDVISKLPPVLILHLKRFDLDYSTFETVKLDSYCSFPHQLNMTPYVDVDCKAAAGVSQTGYEYRLCGVVVHRGVAGGGHYYSIARDRESGKWYKFNDEMVTGYNPKDIPGDCFGKWTNTDGDDSEGSAENLQSEDDTEDELEDAGPPNDKRRGRKPLGIPSSAYLLFYEQYTPTYNREVSNDKGDGVANPAALSKLENHLNVTPSNNTEPIMDEVRERTATCDKDTQMLATDTKPIMGEIHERTATCDNGTQKLATDTKPPMINEIHERTAGCDNDTQMLATDTKPPMINEIHERTATCDHDTQMHGTDDEVANMTSGQLENLKIQILEINVVALRQYIACHKSMLSFVLNLSDHSTAEIDTTEMLLLGNVLLRLFLDIVSHSSHDALIATFGNNLAKLCSQSETLSMRFLRRLVTPKVARHFLIESPVLKVRTSVAQVLKTCLEVAFDQPHTHTELTSLAFETIKAVFASLNGCLKYWRNIGQVLDLISSSITNEVCSRMFRGPKCHGLTYILHTILADKSMFDHIDEEIVTHEEVVDGVTVLDNDANTLTTRTTLAKTSLSWAGINNEWNMLAGTSGQKPTAPVVRQLLAVFGKLLQPMDDLPSDIAPIVSRPRGPVYSQVFQNRLAGTLVAELIPWLVELCKPQHGDALRNTRRVVKDLFEYHLTSEEITREKLTLKDSNELKLITQIAMVEDAFQLQRIELMFIGCPNDQSSRNFNGLIGFGRKLVLHEKKISNSKLKYRDLNLSARQHARVVFSVLRAIADTISGIQPVKQYMIDLLRRANWDDRKQLLSMCLVQMAAWCDDYAIALQDDKKVVATVRETSKSLRSLLPANIDVCRPFSNVGVDNYDVIGPSVLLDPGDVYCVAPISMWDKQVPYDGNFLEVALQFSCNAKRSDTTSNYVVVIFDARPGESKIRRVSAEDFEEWAIQNPNTPWEYKLFDRVEVIDISAGSGTLRTKESSSDESEWKTGVVIGFVSDNHNRNNSQADARVGQNHVDLIVQLDTKPKRNRPTNLRSQTQEWNEATDGTLLLPTERDKDLPEVQIFRFNVNLVRPSEAPLSQVDHPFRIVDAVEIDADPSKSHVPQVFHFNIGEVKLRKGQRLGILNADAKPLGLAWSKAWRRSEASAQHDHYYLLQEHLTNASLEVVQALSNRNAYDSGGVVIPIVEFAGLNPENAMVGYHFVVAPEQVDIENGGSSKAAADVMAKSVEVASASVDKQKLGTTADDKQQ